MKPNLPEGHLLAWRHYYPSFWRILAAIEADLAAAGLPSLSWYDALYELYLAPGRHLRMNELARHALLSRSGLTRLVDKLEKEKLIERRSEGEIKFHVASLYPLLYRLEERGWLHGRWVEKAGERRRRYYSLTPEGRRVLARQRETWKAFVRAMGLVTGVRHA